MLQCDSTYNMEDSSVPGLSPSRAYEGQGEDICNYYVTFHSKYGCPKRANKYAKLSPQITAGKCYKLFIILLFIYVAIFNTMI